MANATTTNKVTEAMVLTAVRAMVENGVDFGTEVSAEDVIAYCDKKMAQAAAKAEKAKEKRAEKSAANDELKERIFALLTDEPMLVDDIVAAIGDEEVTKGKVVSRLTALVKEERVTKSEVKVEGSKGKKSAYSI